jgi:DNA modification methylase
MPSTPSDPLTLINSDALSALRSLPDDSVQCCVTSPPYWGLRDYGVTGAIGIEPTMAEFLANLIAVFAEVRRVLRPDGTCWVNMGDSYATGTTSDRKPSATGKHGYWENPAVNKRVDARDIGLKAKDMIGQPWRLAFALQDDGWYLRSEIIWAKPNPMPESVEDRPTKSHEQIFLLSKSPNYFYNAAAAREPVNGNAHARGNGVNPKCVPTGWDTTTGEGGHGTIHRDGRTGKTPGKNSRIYQDRDPAHPTQRKPTRPQQHDSFSAACNELVHDRNWRDVWTFATEGYDGAHFATFPTELAKRCILASTRPGDTVLDPFAGSGTTGAVAIGLARRALLIELNPQYCDLIRERCTTTIGLPLSA